MIYMQQHFTATLFVVDVYQLENLKAESLDE